MNELPLDLPVISIRAQNLAEGWERAVLACWEQGMTIETQYDRPGDPPSRDVTLCLAIAEPFSEPRLHRALPGGIYDLEIYCQEVIDGLHDHWIDPEAGKWQYTYHERLTAYSVPGVAEPVDQLAYVVETLAAAPESRRAQATLWKPWEDGKTDHPACLQRLWFRLVGDRLVMSAHMRSNDAYKAAFMNMFAFTALQQSVAERLGERLGRPIVAGQYNHIADSFHIYGSYFEDFRGFLETLEKRSFEQRTYTMAQMAPLFEEAREKIRGEKR
ncbi:MAG TPA: thymidylate synthase [Armatimonadota bacterium]|jgi:thymidylate synthase